jgi:hypothetical protein
MTILGRLVLEGIAAVRGAEDGATARQDSAYVSELEFARPFGPDQAIEAIRNADDPPLIFQDGGFYDCAYNRVQAGRVAPPVQMPMQWMSFIRSRLPCLGSPLFRFAVPDSGIVVT